jgi:hypothetical protein
VRRRRVPRRLLRCVAGRVVAGGTSRLSVDAGAVLGEARLADTAEEA